MLLEERLTEDSDDALVAEDSTLAIDSELRALLEESAEDSITDDELGAEDIGATLERLFVEPPEPPPPQPSKLNNTNKITAIDCELRMMHSLSFG
jgi:hypothetical protein